MLYSNGDKIKQDWKKAVYWLEKVANQEYANAQYHLAIMYYNGKGIRKNIEKAKVLLEKASAQGHERAKNILQGMSQNK